jgi:hypothetical protein
MDKKIRLRYHYNRVILDKLAELVEKYPDLRFIQLLHGIGIVDADGRDRFAEESVDTWEGIVKNKMAFPDKD